MHHKRRITLNKTLTVVIMLTYSVILILLICMDWYLIETYQSNKREEEERFLYSYVQEVDEDLNRINDILYDVYQYNTNFDALSGNLTEIEEYDNVYDLDYSLRGKVFLEEQLHGYIFYYSANENVRYYMDSQVIPSNDIGYIKQVVRARIEENTTNWQWFSIEANENKYALLIGKKKNVSLCMVYSLSQVEKKIATDMDFEGKAFFIDANVAFKHESDEVYQEILSQVQTREKGYQGAISDSYIYANRVENTSLWMCLEIPISIYSYMNVQQIVLLAITVFSLFGEYFLYRYMKKEMVLPLRDLIDTMNRIKDGEWEAKTSGEVRFEEIQRVNETLETMVSEIKRQRMLSYEQTIEKQQTQLRYLQLQLKPHFYLNGLKTLNVLAMNGETEKIQDMIINLSYHLRYLLQVEKEMSSLASEIEYVKNYEKLQKNMTGRLFSVEWNVQVDTNIWRVPTFCIETFVENSFKYAKLGDAQKKIIIHITICELETEDGKFLDICIRDNGAGYDKHILEEINGEPTAESESVGINNIKRRCILLYGEKAAYGFYNENGAVSELIIPWQEEKKNAHEYTDSR